jgi:hypothetical protein
MKNGNPAMGFRPPPSYRLFIERMAEKQRRSITSILLEALELLMKREARK